MSFYVLPRTPKSENEIILTIIDKDKLETVYLVAQKMHRGLILLLSLVVLLSVLMLTINWLQVHPQILEKLTGEAVPPVVPSRNLPTAELYKLVPPQEGVTYQGHGVPVIAPSGENPMGYEPNKEFPTVDGSEAGFRSMSMFAYNHSDPRCCPSAYSSDRGCVCTTPEQVALLDWRGANKSKSVNTEW